MGIKIFFNDRAVILTDKKIINPAIDNDLVYVFEDRKALAKRLTIFENSNNICLQIIHHDLNKLFEHFKHCFKFVEAAGGLITLPDRRILLIKRLGKWDLPKGKAERGESLQETALREVMEECGLEKLPIITGELTHTYHTYHQKGNHILKHTAWYAMRYNGNEKLRPQFAEDIVHAAWFPQNLLSVVRKNTYQSIQQVLDEWINKNK